MQPIDAWTLHGTLARLHKGEISPDDVWQQCTSRIDRLNERLKAFITTMHGLGAENDGVQAPGHSAAPALDRMPIAIKDLIDVAGIPTTAGSLFFTSHVADRDAQVVSALREAGARIIGKTNTHELALGVTTANPHFGACRNPWDESRSPGGSSGGSAVAVAAGMALAALGTDTGGSIRIPAALCGIVGLKPTYGRVSLRGVIPLSWNLDHAGPLTADVTDAALLLGTIAGFDKDDPASVEIAVDDYLAELDQGIRGWRLVQVSGSVLKGTDPEIVEAVQAAAATFREAGAILEEMDLGFLRGAAAANGLMTQTDAATFHHERLDVHPEMFGADVRRRLEIGRAATAGDYVRARRTQAETRWRLDRLLQDHDLLILPTTAIAAPKLDEGDPVEWARQLTRFTAPFNLAGLPAISIPCGFTSAGLPIGLQLVANAWQEATVLRAARSYERLTDWNLRRPALV